MLLRCEICTNFSRIIVAKCNTHGRCR